MNAKGTFLTGSVSKAVLLAILFGLHLQSQALNKSEDLIKSPTVLTFLPGIHSSIVTLSLSLMRKTYQKLSI